MIALVVAASLAIVVDETWLGPVVAVLGVLGALALLDAVLAAGRLRGLCLELPAVTRGTVDRPLALGVRILSSPEGGLPPLQLSLGSPPGLESVQEELRVLCPEGETAIRVPWECIPRKRGRLLVREARVGISSPMGFWDRWIAVPLAAEIRSYPNLLPERRTLAALFLNRGGVGTHSQRQLGRGREFEKLREYIPGDGFQEIHWKATARRGHPMTKVFQLERTQEVYVVIDASRLSARPCPGGHGEGAQPAALEQFITAALVLCQVAEHQGDLFGMTVFSDRVERFVRARNGAAHFQACRDALYQLEPREVTPDHDELSTFLRIRLRRRALLLYLTALDDPILSESFVRHARLLASQHLLVVCMPRPAGMQPLFDGGSPSSAEGVYERLAGHLRWQKLREQAKVLQRLGVQFHLVDHSALSIDLVTRYLSVKQRQQL